MADTLEDVVLTIGLVGIEATFYLTREGFRFLKVIRPLIVPYVFVSPSVAKNSAQFGPLKMTSLLY